MSERNRVPAGTGSSGGQFASSGHIDTGLQLAHVPEYVEVFDASGDVCQLTPGVIDEEARWVYTNGQCLALAVALARRTGWPLATTTIEELDPDGAEPDGYRHHALLRHASVLTPAGDLLDINGDNDAEAIEHYPEDTFVLHSSPDEVDQLLAEQEGHLMYQDLAVAEMFVDVVLAEVWSPGTAQPT